jgi:hypothetical protein
MRTFNKKNDTNLAKRVGDATITTAAALLDMKAGGIPTFSATWIYCKAILGNAMELRQQRVSEWLEMVQSHPDLFHEERLNSVEFQDAFVVALEDYIKIRTVLKRCIARKIFMDYTATNDKDRFELERFNTTLRQISTESLQFMGYLKHVVEPRQQERVQSMMDRIDFSKTEASEDLARAAFVRQNPLSYAYKDLRVGKSDQVMLPNKPTPQYPTIQGATGISVPDEERQTHDRCLHELTSLGIITRDRYTTPESDTDPKIIFHDIWNYTQYGRDFSNFLQEAA